jgi:hypothetical protein
MLVTRYKTLIAFPGIPSGEIIAKTTGHHAYFGETHTDFFLSQDVVETDPLSYQFISVTDATLATITTIETGARWITKTAFLERLTPAEHATILSAASSSPAINVWKDRFNNHEGKIHLDDAPLRNGLLQFEGAGLLAAGRTDLILA